MDSILTVDGLNTRFFTPDGEVEAVSDVSFQVAPGESVGVVVRYQRVGRDRKEEDQEPREECG